MSDVPTNFAPYFDGWSLSPQADTELMRRAQQLRYEVYCQECRFLPQQAYSNGRESDAHDARAAHFCALDRRQQMAGYVRLVSADPQGRFPFHDHCAALFDDVTLPAPGESGEISRLMVHPQYRRRRGDALAGVTVLQEASPQVERRNDSPQIMLCMFRQMYQYSLAAGTRYWYAAMERPLALALVRLGFAFEPIGPVTDYYGPVAPYLADLRQLELKLREAKPDLLNWMRAPLAQ